MVVVADDVAQQKLRGASRRREVEGHEAGVAAELPGDGESTRRFASGDLAAGAALKLEPSAEP